MSCKKLLKCKTGSACPSAAGVKPVTYIGNVSDIDPASLTFGPNGEITGFGLRAGASLYKFESKRFKQAGRWEKAKAENDSTVFNQFFDLVNYISTQEDIAAIEQLDKADDIFVIAQLNSGKLQTWGIGRDDNGSYDGFGLSLSGGGGTTGVNLGDDNSDKTTLSGEFPNIPMFFKPAVSLALNIAALDALTNCDSSAS